MASRQHTKIAICYDFDGTLSPCNMQETSFIPKLGLSADAFWHMVAEESIKNDMDRVLAYMNIMLREAKNKKLSMTRTDLQKHGTDVPLFNGVTDWFKNINTYGESKNIEIEHYIISSGIEEVIEGTPIGKEFNKIFACKFVYDENNQAVSAATAVNYTNKTQFLFRINKGILNYYENKKVNQYTPKEEKIIPFSNMIYIGDGETDVPCMKMIMGQGGTAIAVYNPENEAAKETAVNLIKHNRADYMAPTDYRNGKLLEQIIKCQIDKIEAIAKCNQLKEQIYNEINSQKTSKGNNHGF